MIIISATVWNVKGSFTLEHWLPDIPPQLPHSSEGRLSQPELYIPLLSELATHWTFFFFQPCRSVGIGKSQRWLRLPGKVTNCETIELLESVHCSFPWTAARAESQGTQWGGSQLPVLFDLVSRVSRGGVSGQVPSTLTASSLKCRQNSSPCPLPRLL